MPIVVHEEDQFIAEARFLEAWMPTADSVLDRLLGARDDATIHVFLATREVHERRFPPRLEDLRALVDAEEPDDEPGARYASAVYAHAATTRTSARHQLPDEVPDGESAIFLDVESIGALAQDCEVSREAMLARVAAHELSHVRRGHISDTPHATYGFIREGDAQRDAWQILAELLGDTHWDRLARGARTAQVRLAASQPGAYRMFGHSSPDSERRFDVREEPLAYAYEPARRLLALTGSRFIEIPAFTSSMTGDPAIGDAVWLTDRELAVGPWVVVGRSAEPSAAHERDLEEIDKEDRRGARPVWLHLRAAEDMCAMRDPSRLPRAPSLLVRELKASERPSLAEADRMDLEVAVQDAAKRWLTDNEAAIDGLAAQGAPEATLAALRHRDPFADV